MIAETARSTIDVHCPCGAEAWVPAALEGRRVRCRACGAAIRVEALALVEVDEPERTSCRTCSTRLTPGLKRCPRCAHERLRRRRSRARPRTRVQPRAETKDRVVPVVLTGAGCLVYLAIDAASGEGLGLAASSLTLAMVAWLATSLLACYLAGQIMFQSNFGRFGVALPKLAAVGVWPDALALLAVLCLPVVGYYVAWVILLVGTWILIAYLFDMSLPEAIFYSFLTRLCVWFVALPALEGLARALGG